ncbi:hypothetical protein TCAL_13230 [Tigriopus californicus]|uniref:Nucleolar protein 56 n=1 Tax=Tigriopus californicus TaxID=6832 RepID=A0A553P4K1_TIGCA|nr:hypothetical protein TCAL_13230 [Tigriopus californicus]
MSGCPSHVLFEHASGYALFTVKEFEEIASLTAEVTRALSDVSAFNGILNLVAFYPFKSAAEALANINAISEGMASEELKIFLQANLPKKLKKVLLGMQEPKLGAFLAEELDGLKVTHVGGSAEILRGVRFHFAKLVKGLTNEASSKAQLGLGHSYSRAKVKFNVHKSDNMIIQAIALLDQLDKDVNTFAMRIREWYSYHFPELIKIVPENLLFARCLTHYLRSKMGSVAPNLATLIGDTVAARLISHAGSLTNLAKYPASTVQILGAEKALFRALKTRGNTPKYGLIFHSSFIGKAGTKNKGRISRYLANKCSIASRIDCFSENSTTIFGEKLKTQVEDRLNFYETGDLPKKNLEVMQEAMAAVAQEVSEFTVVTKKKKKKKRKAEEAGEAEAEADVEQAPPSKKKKKEEPAEAVAPETPKSEKKKKKKAKEQEAEPEPEPEAVTQTTASEKKKKKKKKNQVE